MLVHKKSIGQFITIAGASQSGKKTLIEEIKRNRSLRERLKIESPFEVYGICFRNPKNAIIDNINTVLLFWQPDEEHFIQDWIKLFPNRDHRVLIPYRKAKSQLPDYLKIQCIPDNFDPLEFLIWIRKVRYQNALDLQIPVEVLDRSQNYKVIKPNWEI